MGSENQKNDPLDGWHPVSEAPKGIFDLCRPSHIMRSKPVWLLQGAYTYRQMSYEPPFEDDGPEVTDPPQVVLGYCVWPLVRFIGTYKDGHRLGKTGEYEKWLLTKEHYFVSLEHDTEHIFPAQYWKEIDVPSVPSWAVDTGFEWGTRHLGWTGNGEYVVGEKNEHLCNLRRASTEEPFLNKESS